MRISNNIPVDVGINRAVIEAMGDFYPSSPSVPPVRFVEVNTSTDADARLDGVLTWLVEPMTSAAKRAQAVFQVMALLQRTEVIPPAANRGTLEGRVSALEGASTLPTLLSYRVNLSDVAAPLALTDAQYSAAVALLVSKSLISPSTRGGYTITNTSLVTSALGTTSTGGLATFTSAFASAVA